MFISTVVLVIAFLYIWGIKSQVDNLSNRVDDLEYQLEKLTGGDAYDDI